MADQRLEDAFYRAAIFLKRRVDTEGWVWSSYYLRERERKAGLLGSSHGLWSVRLQAERGELGLVRWKYAFD
jgi:hypothetical protein